MSAQEGWSSALLNGANDNSAVRRVSPVLDFEKRSRPAVRNVFINAVSSYRGVYLRSITILELSGFLERLQISINFEHFEKDEKGSHTEFLL